MSAPIQRYDFHDGYLEDDAEGRFIRYADHVRVVEKQASDILEWLANRDKRITELKVQLEAAVLAERERCVKAVSGYFPNVQMDDLIAAIRHDPATLSTNEKTSEAPRGGT